MLWFLVTTLCQRSHLISLNLGQLVVITHSPNKRFKAFNCLKRLKSCIMLLGNNCVAQVRAKHMKNQFSMNVMVLMFNTTIFCRLVTYLDWHIYRRVELVPSKQNNILSQMF